MARNNGNDPTTELAIPDRMVNVYLANGYKADEVAELEEIASEIRDLKRSTAQGIYEIGLRLNTVKEDKAHGTWQFYVESRCGISLDSAQRFMSVANLIGNTPALADHMGNFALTALYTLAQNKRVTPEVVSEVLEWAQEGEVNEAIVRDAITRNNPAEERAHKAQRLGFVPMSNADGLRYSDEATQLINAVFRPAFLAGLNADIVAKNREYKDFVGRIVKGKGDSELERSINGFLMACWLFSFSSEHGDEYHEAAQHAAQAAIDAQSTADPVPGAPEN